MPTTRPRLDHGEVVREAREDVRERALKCGPRRRDRLAPDEWTRRSALCDAESATFVLDDPDYYCRYPISVLVARR